MGGYRYILGRFISGDVFVVEGFLFFFWCVHFVGFFGGKSDSPHGFVRVNLLKFCFVSSRGHCLRVYEGKMTTALFVVMYL